MSDRHAEIWATRLQRELLALTTDDDIDHKDVAGVLPPFITLKNHELDIAKGTCKVAFQIEVPAPKKETPAEPQPTVVDLPPPAAGENGDTPPAEKAVAPPPAAEETAAAQTADAEPTSNCVVLSLDVSLPTKPDGSIDASAVAYPFQEPTAVLLSGSELFPEGSTIKDGDLVDFDCDWTPSLHLTDAVLNVGLKIKECVLQGEPFHGAGPQFSDSDPMEEVMKGARRIGSFFSKSAKGLVGDSAEQQQQKPKRSIRKKKVAPKKEPVTDTSEIKIGDEINLLEAPWVDCMGVYSCKAIRRPGFVEDAMAKAEVENKAKEVSSSLFDEDDEGEVPSDFNNYMRLQAGSITKVAGAGFAGAGSMFRSFAQSAKSVLEESFLMVTPTYIVELKTSKLSLSTGTVTIAIPIELLAKLKFRRQESISLFFKPAPDDPLIFMCPDSADAVHQIQSVLKKHGVKGKHTNAATQRSISDAMQLVQVIQAKERTLDTCPTVERVNEIMDLYRQAAERFEVAGDIRHEEVMTHMRKFLALPLTVSILDGSYEKKPQPQPTIVDVPPVGGSTPASNTTPTAVPQGEVLERTQCQLDDDDMSAEAAKEDSKKEDKAFHENMDNILKEAKEDLENLDMDDDEINELLKVDGEAAGESDDAIADLDAMLSAADKELADLMSS